MGLEVGRSVRGGGGERCERQVGGVRGNARGVGWKGRVWRGGGTIMSLLVALIVDDAFYSGFGFARIVYIFKVNLRNSGA